MRILITGHCGFIGSRLWDRLKRAGHEVWGIDDLSRSTSTPNHDPNSLTADVSEIRSIAVLDQKFDWVIHLAAQVSVVNGEADPVRDFNTNALGTFEVLQWAKARSAKIIYSSTNKVFGELDDVSSPISDSAPLLPQTNYGVSKACGAHYVSDYEDGWVLHQSCIYGPTQLGTEDQGWVGWLANSIRSAKPITCFGDGSQIRDLLHVEDLLDLYESILLGRIMAGSYVVGGGAGNAVSFSEAVRLLGGSISKFDAWRPHDQKYFVSANEGLLQQGWNPRVSHIHGLNELSHCR